MSRVLDHLRNEHRAILDVVSRAEAVSAAAHRGETIAPDVIETLRQFFAMFVHGVHQRKEDSILFPVMKLKGLREGAGCVGLLASEHEETAGAFPEAVDPSVSLAAMGPYCALLRNHIRREEDVLFPKMAQVLTPEDEAQLLLGFRSIDEAAKRAGSEDIAAAVGALQR